MKRASPLQSLEVFEETLGNFQVHTIQTGRWHENCYLVQNLTAKEMLVIDPGGEEEKIFEIAKSSGARVSLLILTHAHHDHVGSLKVLTESFDLPFHMHQDDLKLLNRAPLYAMSFEKRTLEVPKNHIFLEKEGLQWAGENIRYLHTPGHTPGGVCYHWAGLAFTGDTLLNRMVGRTDLPGASPELLSASIERLFAVLPPETWIFPGHGRPWQVKEAKIWWQSQNKKVEKSNEYRDE